MTTRRGDVQGESHFDHQIPRSSENARAYASFVCAVAERDGLRHFDRSAVGRLIEYGSRAVEDQEKLSARFGLLRDVITEADYWGQGGKKASGGCTTGTWTARWTSASTA